MATNAPARSGGEGHGAVSRAAQTFELEDGAVLIAAITSCTNTSNPGRDGRRRPARAQCARRGLDAQAVGQDEPRAGLEGRHRLPREGGPARRSRGARLQPRRLRLHDLHRQLRPAAPEIADARAGPATSSRCAVLSGNRNFEGRVHPGSEDELPRLAAARRRVCARGHAWTSISTTRAARHGQRRQARLPARTSGRSTAGNPRARSPSTSTRRCSSRATPACSTATRTGRPINVPQGEIYHVGRQVDLREEPALLRRHDDDARHAVSDISGARVLALLGDSVTTDHISPAGNIAQDEPGRASTSSSRACSRWTSTPTARGAAITR